MTRTQSLFLDTCLARCETADVHQRITSHNHCNDVYVSFRKGGFDGPEVDTASLVAGKVTYSWAGDNLSNATRPPRTPDAFTPAYRGEKP